MHTRALTIINRLGLHARAVAKLVSVVSAFQSEIKIAKDGKEVNGKSIMGVMMLAASQHSTIHITATGDDAQQVLDKLEELVNDRFGEPE